MAANLPSFLILLSLFLLTQHSTSAIAASNEELRALLDLKSSLDPSDTYLSSWSINGAPCQDGFFEGVACNEDGLVANISLQGKGLKGQLSSAIGGLKHLTGLYLHYNSLHGEIPKEISGLTLLSDLYLDVNNFSGDIPPEIGSMENLQVLQLCYNQISGSIPTQLGSLKKLSVVALQFNQLTGAIPASLGDLPSLARLDLSSNRLFGSVPSRLADPPLLQALNLRNNSLSGSVPPALKRLNEGFQYTNNKGLCGEGFESLTLCSSSDHQMPEGAAAFPTKDIPETANVLHKCNKDSQCSSNPTPKKKRSHAPITAAVFLVIFAFSAIGIVFFTQYRRRKQRLGSLPNISDSKLSTDHAPLEGHRKAGSPLISLEYPNGWDPLAHHDELSKETIQSFRYNLEEIESATQHFSYGNLMGRGGFSAVYRGILRDGSAVAVKKISKCSLKSAEAEFLKGLNTLTSLRHENLVRLRGFCCSRERGECFLVYDFIANGNLSTYLDLKAGDAKILEWPTRVSIIKGIAKGIQYLHSYKVTKPSLVHGNISAEKVLINHQFNPLLSDSGLNGLLTNDAVFSTLKASAAMGYLAPEYTTTGKFTEKSDVYAFGIVVLQIMSGRRKITEASRTFHDLIDPNLNGRFSEDEAAKIGRLATLCAHESSFERPSMEAVVVELDSCSDGLTSC